MSSSDASSPCRLEWRRSLWVPAARGALPIAAILAFWLSALPLVACGVGVVLVLADGIGLLRRERWRPDCVLSWAGGGAPRHMECTGRIESMQHFGATIRGGLVVLTLVDPDATLRRYWWWPDTLGARGRRDLQLVLRVQETVTPMQSKLAE